MLLSLFVFLFSVAAHPTEVAPVPPPQVPDSAYAQDAYDRGDPRVENHLLVDAGVARPGESVGLGVLFTMDPGWHIYWRFAGEGGMSTEVLFEAGPAEVGPVQWPTPTVFHEAGGTILTFGYADQVLLFSEVELPADLVAGDEIELTADVDYLVCEVDCIPGRGSLSRTLVIGEETSAADDATERLFDRAHRAVPRSADQLGIDVDLRYSHAPIQSPDEFRVEISVIACQDPTHTPGTDCIELQSPPERPADAFVFDGLQSAQLEVARVSPHPDAHSGWFIELAGRASRDVVNEDDRLTGVLRLMTADGIDLATEVDELFPRTESDAARALVVDRAIPADAPQERDHPSLLYVLLLAFLGGALLNLMPCVFPVLAIKVFSFVNLVHEERQNIYLHSAAYTAGIVASMITLAAAVIALQLVGTHVGWGFQFQEPRFIAFVGAVLVIFALNLFGLFEVTLNPGRLQDVATAAPSVRRSAAEGVLAVVLATPCSAPFLGTAVGFALASTPLVIALIFFVLGLGLAAPFVILTLTPGAAKLLPKPGAWMNHFKQLLGFALLATTIWLLWLIGQMNGAGAITALLIFYLACALAAWIFGLVQFRSPRARAIGLLFALAIVATSAFFTLRFDQPAPAHVDNSPAQGEIPWQPWSEEAVQAALNEGRPVFVDFTADWCITCKVNKRTVIETPEVIAAIDTHNVAMFIADWTRRDEGIRTKLAEFGKAGVPMYLLYAPTDPKNPQVLPELLTRNLLLSAFNGAAAAH